MVALLSSFVAKEITAGTLAVLFSVSASDQQAIMQAVHNAISPAGALAFVVASHFYIPCLGSMAVLKSELGSWKKNTASACRDVYSGLRLSLYYLSCSKGYHLKRSDITTEAGTGFFIFWLAKLSASAGRQFFLSFL